MTTVFHKRLYGRFIEIQSNLRREKLQRTDQGSNFLEGSFSNRDNVGVLKEIKYYFHHKIIISQNITSEVHIKKFFIKKSCFLLEIFSF